MRADSLQLKNRGPAAGKRPGREVYPRLRIAVAVVWGVFIAYCLYRLIEEPAFIVANAAVIATVALIPAFLWAGGVVPGLPILPLHTLTFLWTHALPLIAGHPEISSYDSEDIVFSTICVGLYAVLVTIAWIAVATRPVAARALYYVLPKDRGFAFFALAIGIGGTFTAATVGQWVSIDPGLFGIVRSSILAFASIALFVLAIRLARGELNQFQRAVFLGVAVFFIITQVTTLFLIGAIVSTASALIGYTIGRGQVPWVTVVVSLLLFGFLHSGKGEMRERYWSFDAPVISIADLPEFFADWLAAGARELAGSEKGVGYQPIHERVSLMHILLLVQRRAPDTVPYLEGATYAIIPALLVPRFIDPDKPHSHQGTAMLNVHFGVQSEEDTARTTIGWGMVNEAYANFGLVGIGGVAILIGFLFGFAGRLTVGAPVMSFQNMVGVTFAAIAIQSEFTMAVFVTVLFQSLVVLLGVVPFLDKQRTGETD